MAKKLHFSWTICERVHSRSDITDSIKQKQIDQLDSMVNLLNEQFSTQLNGVEIISCRQRDCSGEYALTSTGPIYYYYVSNSFDITVSKVGEESTWYDVYSVINTIKPAEISFHIGN